MAISTKNARTEKWKGQVTLSAVVICVAFLLLLAGGAYLALASHGGPVKSTGTYSVTHPVEGSYSRDIECRGTVRPIRIVDVHAHAKGKVSSVSVKEGDYAYQGKLLFEVIDEKGVSNPVTAEIPGTITNLKVENDMLTDQIDAAGYAMQIADMNVLVGDVSIQESAVPFIEIGEWASVFPEQDQNVEYDAMVIDLEKSSDVDTTRSGQALYEAVLFIDDFDDLAVGTPIIAHVPIDDFGQVYFVPEGAVREEGDLAFVEVVRANGVIEQHQVELLGTSEDGTKIIKGSVLTSDVVIRSDLGE